MLYAEATGSYNHRRYGKPWIAVVSYENPGNPTYQFGDYIGDSTGGCGERSVECKAGDVLAKGQKDVRNGRGGASDFGVVDADGSVRWGFTVVTAREEAKAIRAAGSPATDPRAVAIAEIRRLMAEHGISSTDLS